MKLNPGYPLQKQHSRKRRTIFAPANFTKFKEEIRKAPLEYSCVGSWNLDTSKCKCSSEIPRKF
jgi:hypothetical protein